MAHIFIGISLDILVHIYNFWIATKQPREKHAAAQNPIFEEVPMHLTTFPPRRGFTDCRFMRAGSPTCTPTSCFYGSIAFHVSPALQHPGADPVLRPIHPWMTVGSGALTVFCLATWTLICFATEKNIRYKTLAPAFRTPTLAFLQPPRISCEIIQASRAAFHAA